MKKLLTLLLALTLTVGTAALTSCDGESSNPSTNEGTNNNGPTGTPDDGDGDKTDPPDSGSPKSYTITLTVNNPECTETVTDITVEKGKKFTLPSLEDTETYEFVKWQLADDATLFYEADAEYEYTLTADAEMVAVWNSWSWEH